MYELSFVLEQGLSEADKLRRAQLYWNDRNRHPERSKEVERIGAECSAVALATGIVDGTLEVSFAAQVPLAALREAARIDENCALRLSSSGVLALREAYEAVLRGGSTGAALAALHPPQMVVSLLSSAEGRNVWSWYFRAVHHRIPRTDIRAWINDVACESNGQALLPVPFGYGSPLYSESIWSILSQIDLDRVRLDRPSVIKIASSLARDVRGCGPRHLPAWRECFESWKSTQDAAHASERDFVEWIDGIGGEKPNLLGLVLLRRLASSPLVDEHAVADLVRRYPALVADIAIRRGVCFAVARELSPRSRTRRHLKWVARLNEPLSAEAASQQLVLAELHDSKYWSRPARRYALFISLRGGHLGAYGPALAAASRGCVRRRQSRHSLLSYDYMRHEIPKANGGVRTIRSPMPWLKSLQKFLNKRIFSDLDRRVHPAAHGFRPGRSIVTNARAHLRSSVILNLDLRHFFPSITERHVERVLASLMKGQGFPPGSIRFLTRTCAAFGRLPTGAPTSPVLSNLVLRGLDRRIASICRAKRLRYTRFADDLTISSDMGSLCDPPAVLEVVAREIREAGFRIAWDKLTIGYSSGGQRVTGLSVKNGSVSVPKVLRRRVRAMIHRRNKHRDGEGAEPHAGGHPICDAHIAGYLAFIAGVEPERAAHLRQRLRP
jgi:hypothetical protein